jgi:molecular chaperone HscB
MPAAFLMQQMQWREALGDATDAAAVQALADEVQHAEQALAQRVRQALDEAREPVAVAAQHVRAWMFVQRFRQDVQARLDALDPVG